MALSSILLLFILNMVSFTQPQTTASPMPPAGSCVFPYFYNGTCYAGCFVGTINGTNGSFCPTQEAATDLNMYDICYGVDALNATNSEQVFKALNDTWKNCAFPFYYNNTCQRRTCIDSNLQASEPPWCPLTQTLVTDSDKMSGRYCYEGNSKLTSCSIDIVVTSVHAPANGTYKFNTTCFETNAQAINVNFTDPNEVIIIRNSLCSRNSSSSPVVCQNSYILGYNNEACVRPAYSGLSCQQDRDCQPPVSCVTGVCKCSLSASYNASMNLCVLSANLNFSNSPPGISLNHATLAFFLLTATCFNRL